MLVLSRRVGERLVIGNDVVVTVMAFRGSQIALGIDAPDDVPIWREELTWTQPTAGATRIRDRPGGIRRKG
jgi:carbon storage regulator